MRAIIKKLKEGKLAAVADQRHLFAMTFIAGITNENGE
jgi:hypothetical protein